MSNLLPIPWQPAYYLTPDTLAILIRASQIVGHNIIVVDAWRSYAAQKALRDYYLADPVNHPFAADPDTGQRNHMRGAAWDARDTDAATQSACRAAGAVRDASEPWHWNNPNWANMPIIPVNTISTGGGNVTPLPPVLDIRKLDTVFSFIRNPANGEITLLDFGTMTRKALSGPEWQSLSANGNAFSNAANAGEYASVTGRFKPKP